MKTEKCTQPSFPSFILEVDISPLHFVKPSFLLRQVRHSLRATLGLDSLEELPGFWIPDYTAQDHQAGVVLHAQDIRILCSF